LTTPQDTRGGIAIKLSGTIFISPAGIFFRQVLRLLDLAKQAKGCRLIEKYQLIYQFKVTMFTVGSFCEK
jgi:hypothetical protein